MKQSNENALNACHTHHHQEGLHCSCCSPLWKLLIPEWSSENNEIESDECSVSDEVFPSPRIFHCKVEASQKGGAPGYIQTLAGGQDNMVEAIGIHNGKIIATGSYDDVKKSMMGNSDIQEIPEEQFIHSGQTLLPGLIEPHLHIIPTAAYNLMTDVGPFLGQDLRTNVAESDANVAKYSQDWIISALQKKAKNTSENWIFGRNADPSLLIDDDKTFNAATLDKVSTTQPVFLMNSSMHLAYLNQAGIDKIQEKGCQVSADGILKELVEILPVMEIISKEMYTNDREKEALIEKLDNEVSKLFAEASARGVTYMLDAGVSPAFGNGPLALSDQPKYLSQRANRKDCPIRIAGSLIAATLEEFNSKIQGKYSANSGDEKFNIAFLKLIADGSNQGLTGYQYSPYECDENFNRYCDLKGDRKLDKPTNTQAEKLQKQTNEGLFNYGYPLEFNALISRAVDNDWPVMIHANGDHAMQRTINGFQQAGVNNTNIQERRDRIEHASILDNQNLSDMKKLGISPSFLIGHVGYWGWVFQETIFGKEKSNKLDRCHSAINDYGMKISLHSDNSVTPLGPLRFMEQAITRLMEGAPEGVSPQVLNESECITRLQALKAVTYDAAWQCHADKWVGSLEEGKCADFVLLAQNPLTYSCEKGVYSAEGLRNLPVLETWKGGVKRYSTEDEIKAMMQQNPSLRVAVKKS